MKTTIAIGIIFALIRIWMGFALEPSHITLIDVFKDAVHVYMGGLFVAMRYEYRMFIGNGWNWQAKLFWSLCALEVIVATVQRM